MILGNPHYHLVPKDYKANLIWRRNLIQEVRNDLEAQAQLRQMCAEDKLFAVNAFYWTFDPRAVACPDLPYITYDFQDEVLMEQEQWISEGVDGLYEKSRAMAATWMILTTLHWRWLTLPRQSFLCVSRNEAYVDKTGDPKSLFWKIDYINKNLPGWLVPPINRNSLHIENLRTESVIDGESTTGEVARGDRRTAIMLDEFAFVEQGDAVLKATRAATNCRIFNSTPNGCANAFYDMAQNPTIRKRRLHWSMHPVYSQGLYYDAEGKPRSPWYDNECLRVANKTEIAQELDIDYAASNYTFFDATQIEQHIAAHAKEPRLRGELTYGSDCSPDGFRDMPADGRLLLWCDLDEQGRPDRTHDYVLGVDVAMGTSGRADGKASSNSVISVCSRTDNKKVAEFAASLVLPEYLAEMAVAMGKWFSGPRGDAFMIWEGKGPGMQFGKRVIELGYRRMYYAVADERKIGPKPTDVPGFHPTTDSKRTLLSDYRSALTNGQFVNPHETALRECLQFIATPGGKVEHSASLRKDDPTGAGDNHGDRVIADALCNKLLRERKLAGLPEAPIKAKPGTFGHRMVLAIRERDAAMSETPGWRVADVA